MKIGSRMRIGVETDSQRTGFGVFIAVKSGASIVLVSRSSIHCSERFSTPFMAFTPRFCTGIVFLPEFTPSYSRRTPSNVGSKNFLSDLTGRTANSHVSSIASVPHQHTTAVLNVNLTSEYVFFCQYVIIIIRVSVSIDYPRQFRPTLDT